MTYEKWEYFYGGEPKLFHAPDGRYLMGLAKLFGAYDCWKAGVGGAVGEVVDHDFVDDKCTRCSIQRRPHKPYG